MLSALYGIMLVVMGVAFPTSQVISIKIPSHYYEVNRIVNDCDDNKTVSPTVVGFLRISLLCGPWILRLHLHSPENAIQFRSYLEET